MVKAWMQVLERLGATRLEHLASEVHLAVLAALTVYWVTPIIAAVIRRMPSRPERLWVRLWICPVCEQLNRRTYANCQRCQKNLPLRWRDRWEMSDFAQNLRKVAQRLHKTSFVTGYFLYYGVPAIALFLFHLNRFQQAPIQELIGSFALGFLLLFFLFVRAAIDSGWRAPVAGFIQLIAGMVMIGGFLSASFLWAGVAVPPEKPLASVTLTPAGNIHVRYAVVSWPLFDIRQTYLMDVQNVSRTKPLTRRIMKQAAAKLNGSSDLEPRVTILEQTLTGAPSRSVEIFQPSSGAGLALRETPAPAKVLQKIRH